MVHVDTPDEEPTHRPRRARRKALRAASGPTGRAVYVIVGAIGLAALAIAIIGPKRIKREAVDPIGDCLEPHYEKAWDEIRPIRDQIAALFEKASPENQKAMARKLQSWIGHFRAS